MSHIDKYFIHEVEQRAMLGPFPSPPFTPWCNTSPIMAKEKSEKGKYRTMIDLCKYRTIIDHPQGENVNDFVQKNNYDGRYISHVLPRMDDIVSQLAAMNYSALLASVDIQRAYRNFPGCPLDYPLTGIKHRGQYYIDLAMPFGARSSSTYTQKSADFIARALRRRGIVVHIYLDDVLVYVHLGQDSLARFTQVLEFINYLGLPLAKNKSQPPDIEVKYLGVYINTSERTLVIPEEKIVLFLALVNWAKEQKVLTRKTVQRLVGKIVHLSGCLPAARTFANGILHDLRHAGGGSDIPITDHTRTDIRWFATYLRRYNGISMMKAGPPKFVIVADACAAGGGASDYASYIAYSFPSGIADTYHISILEALNCLVALRILITSEKHHSVVEVKCDNSATVQVITRGGQRDKYLAAIARAIWYVAARTDVKLVFTHVPGERMQLADSLSCMTSSPSHKRLAEKFIADLKLKFKEVKAYHFNFVNFV